MKDGRLNTADLIHVGDTIFEVHKDRRLVRARCDGYTDLFEIFEAQQLRDWLNKVLP